MKDRRILFWVLLISIAHFSASTKALAGIWDSLPLRPFAITGSGTTGEAPAAYAIPGQDAPQKLVSQFCERVVACMPGESANSVRWQCVLRLTGDEGKNLWAALVSNFAEDPPTTLKLSQWIQQKQAHADPAKYYACLNSLRDFSCEAIQGRYSGTDLSWAGQLIAEAGSCDDVFTGPATAGEFAEKGAIHVFARCLDEQGEGRTCHWQGPPGGNLWGNQYWFHQLPMKAGQPISVDYHHGAKTLSMVAYVKDGGDLGGAGSAHVMFCKTEGFSKSSFDCGPDYRRNPDKVHYNPIIWNEPYTVNLEGKLYMWSHVFFNTGTWPFPTGDFERTGLVGRRLENNDEKIDENPSRTWELDDLYAWGTNCQDRAIDHSPSYLVSSRSVTNMTMHQFAVGNGNRLFHAWGEPPSSGSSNDLFENCMVYETGPELGNIRSSPRAIYGNSEQMEIYALGDDNYPSRWTLDGSTARSEKLTDVKADFKIDNWMGVTLTPNDRFTHVFFRREGTKNIGHIQLDPASGIWRSPDRAGIAPLQVLDSPAAVTDLQGNIHLFVGEKDSPRKPGDNRAYLHHFVKPAGSTEWKSETLTLGNVQHTDNGVSAAAAIFFSSDGQTTERKQISHPATSGTSNSGPSNLGGAEPAHGPDCIEGVTLVENDARCSAFIGQNVYGRSITAAYGCLYEPQGSQIIPCPEGTVFSPDFPGKYTCLGLGERGLVPSGARVCAVGYEEFNPYAPDPPSDHFFTCIKTGLTSSPSRCYREGFLGFKIIKSLREAAAPFHLTCCGR